MDGVARDTMKTARVLIVDDSRTQRLVKGARLRSLGYRAEEAENGRTALNRLRRGGIDIVLSDWMMPELDGVGLCRAVREFGDDSYVYFVLMTAKQDGNALAEGLAAGADDFLVKPFEMAELTARLRALIRRTGGKSTTLCITA